MANYLYNGVPLSDIYSVYTTEVQALNPFAVIVQNNSSGDYFFMADDETFTANSDGDTISLFPGVAYALENDEWVPSSGRINCKAIWANHDILNADGSLYLAASEPVPVSTYTPNPTAMTMGMLVGQAIRRMRGMVLPEPEQPEQPSGKLVGYLYGGVGPLPDINEVWTDKETYPYALWFAPIENNSVGTLVLTACRFQFNAAKVENNPQFNVLNEGICAYYYTPLTEDGITLLESIGMTAGLNEFVFAQGGTFTTGIRQLGGLPIWTSADILNTDGSTYLAASDPVPVYE